MFFLRRLFLKDRAGKFRGKILSGRKSGPGRKSGMSVLMHQQSSLVLCKNNVKIHYLLSRKHIY